MFLQRRVIARRTGTKVCTLSVSGGVGGSPTVLDEFIDYDSDMEYKPAGTNAQANSDPYAGVWRVD